MEFLYKLYSNDFFGIGLFIVITILAFSFLIILFFGKKDEKARNEESKTNNELEMNNEKTDPEKTEPLETIELSTEVPKLEENIEESVQIENPVVENFVSEEKEDNDNYFEPVEIEQYESISNNNLEEKEDFSTSFEEENNELNQNDFVIESFNIDTPVIEEPTKEDIFSDNLYQREPEPKKVAMPKQFSSVYVSKKNEEPIKEEKRENIEENMSPISLKKDIDLPKPFDLPKLNKKVGTTSVANDNIIKTFNNNEDSLNNLFDNLEEDSYSIRK